MVIKLEPQRLTQLARMALYEELLTYPKPGLVSLIDSGSHNDMNGKTFLASIQALEEYFGAISHAGSRGAGFTELNQLGLAAEQAMLDATGQVNTHRGAIFILGLLVAATAHTLSRSEDFNAIRTNLVRNWGADLIAHQGNRNSHGASVRQQFQLGSIVLDAAHGFPRIFALQHRYTKLCLSYKVKYARLIMFFQIMQELNDTNLVYRGGINGLKFAKAQAKQILTYQNNPPQFCAYALKLHREFVQRNLSPGGCADVLAGVMFLSRVRQIWA